VLLPPGPEDLAFDLHWSTSTEPSSATEGWLGVCSLGEDASSSAPLTGEGLERFGDTYFMCGDLREHHLREGQLSTWWLTAPGIDVEAFHARLGTSYELMSQTFGAPAHPYRMFLRAQPHRGANASAHPASFVMAMNPSRPLDVGSLYETLAHELVHEWLHLDGSDHEKTWFVEGSADYYSLVLPLRAGMTDEAAFLEAVNFEARECYANPQRGLSIQQAQQLFFSDFMAHRLPYARGMFYLADLDARLRRETSQKVGVDDLVRDIVRDRSVGEHIGISGWCTRVEHILHRPEMPHLDDIVLTGAGRPCEDAFGSQFEMEMVDVPVPDFGFDASTLVTGHVRGLVLGGAADRAGLHEGEDIEPPRCPEIVRMNLGDSLDIKVSRRSETAVVTIPLTGETAVVPQWRTRPHTKS
jgi:predicted metalloprotease with PDZ domain